MLRRADRRDLPRDAVFFGTTPFRTAWSNRLIARPTEVSAWLTSPPAMDRRAEATPFLVALRTPRFRCERFTCCRAAFLAVKSFLLTFPRPLDPRHDYPSSQRHLKRLNHYKPLGMNFQRQDTRDRNDSHHSGIEYPIYDSRGSRFPDTALLSLLHGFGQPTGWRRPNKSLAQIYNRF